MTTTTSRVTMSGVLQEISKELGYNPYHSVKLASGAIVPFTDFTRYTEEIKQTFAYEGAKAVREQGVKNFFKNVTPFPCEDTQLLGLMIEMMIRQDATPTNFDTLYLGDTTDKCVEFCSVVDLLTAVEQLQSHLLWLKYYHGIQTGQIVTLASMPDNYLINAWFARFINLKDAPQLALEYFSVAELVKVSPQFDGIVFGLSSALLNIR